MSDLWTMIDVYCADGPLAGKRMIVDGRESGFNSVDLGTVVAGADPLRQSKLVRYQRYTFGDERRHGAEPLIIFPKWPCVEWSLSDAADWGGLFAHRLNAPAMIRVEWCIGAVDRSSITQDAVNQVMGSIPPRSREITVDEPPRGWQWPMEYRRGYVPWGAYSINRPVPLLSTKAVR